MQVMALLMSVLSKILWALLCVFIGVYVLNFILVGEALATWDFYTWFAHGIVVSVWSILAYLLGYGSARLRNRQVVKDQM